MLRVTPNELSIEAGVQIECDFCRPWMLPYREGAQLCARNRDDESVYSQYIYGAFFGISSIIIEEIPKKYRRNEDEKRGRAKRGPSRFRVSSGVSQGPRSGP